MKYDLNEIAKNLFETLRKCDDLGVQHILCQGFEENGVGLAIMNRLNKAAGYDIIRSINKGGWGTYSSFFINN